MLGGARQGKAVRQGWVIRGAARQGRAGLGFVRYGLVVYRGAGSSIVFRAPADQGKARLG